MPFSVKGTITSVAVIVNPPRGRQPASCLLIKPKTKVMVLGSSPVEAHYKFAMFCPSQQKLSLPYCFCPNTDPIYQTVWQRQFLLAQTNDSKL